MSQRYEFEEDLYKKIISGKNAEPLFLQLKPQIEEYISLIRQIERTLKIGLDFDYISKNKIDIISQDGFDTIIENNKNTISDLRSLKQRLKELVEVYFLPHENTIRCMTYSARTFFVCLELKKMQERRINNIILNVNDPSMLKIAQEDQSKLLIQKYISKETKQKLNDYLLRIEIYNNSNNYSNIYFDEFIFSNIANKKDEYLEILNSVYLDFEKTHSPYYNSEIHKKINEIKETVNDVPCFEFGEEIISTLRSLYKNIITSLTVIREEEEEEETEEPGIPLKFNEPKDSSIKKTIFFLLFVCFCAFAIWTSYTEEEAIICVFIVLGAIIILSPICAYYFYKNYVNCSSPDAIASFALQVTNCITKIKYPTNSTSIQRNCLYIDYILSTEKRLAECKKNLEDNYRQDTKRISKHIGFVFLLCGTAFATLLTIIVSLLSSNFELWLLWIIISAIISSIIFFNISAHIDECQSKNDSVFWDIINKFFKKALSTLYKDAVEQIKDVYQFLDIPSDVILIHSLTYEQKIKTKTPYGDLTRYITPQGLCYHKKYGCSSSFMSVNLYDIIYKHKYYRPCEKCGQDDKKVSLPEWYVYYVNACSIIDKFKDSQKGVFHS